MTQINPSPPVSQQTLPAVELHVADIATKGAAIPNDEHASPPHDAPNGTQTSSHPSPAILYGTAEVPTHARVPTPDPARAASLAAIWPTKMIRWPPGTDSSCLVIMQSRNGPCSLIALCNVLILRKDIQILPEDRPAVSYEYLASLIADFLVSRIPEGDSGDVFDGLSAALAKLPDLQDGMNINSVWSDHSSFRQLGEGGELKLFELCGVELVHGWLADSASPEYEALLKVGDYDGAVNLIVAADDLTKGQLVLDPDSTTDIGQEQKEGENRELSVTQQATVKDALVIRQFLESNSSQLTYSGLFDLTSTLKPGLYALFRNSHLSVLCKTEAEDRPLFTLVTDSVFTREQAVVWETLEDVDGSASTFVDADLVKSSTAGGDYSGRTAEAAVRDAERRMEGLTLDGDLALARHLQAEEDHMAAEHEQRRADRRAQNQSATPAQPPGRSDRQGGSQEEGSQMRGRVGAAIAKGKDKDCCIM